MKKSELRQIIREYILDVLFESSAFNEGRSVKGGVVRLSKRDAEYEKKEPLKGVQGFKDWQKKNPKGPKLPSEKSVKEDEDTFKKQAKKFLSKTTKKTSKPQKKK